MRRFGSLERSIVKAYPNIWSKFIQSTHTLHLQEGVLQDWHKGRTAYALWILRIESEPILIALRALQRSIITWIDPVEDFHITLWVSGFPTSSPQYNDDVLKSDLEDAAQRVQMDSPISVRLGQINSFQTAAFVEIDDHLGHIRAVREQLSTHREIRFGPYTPHITLGNYTHSYPTTPIKTHLESLQPICGTLNFDTVEWVEFTPQGNRKALRCIKSVHRGTKT